MSSSLLWASHRCKLSNTISNKLSFNVFVCRLYGATCMQIFSYHQSARSKQDPPILRFGVRALFPWTLLPWLTYRRFSRYGKMALVS